MSESLKQICKDAITVQSACNFTGVAYSLAQIAPAVRADAARQERWCTTDINRHPVFVLYAAKLAELAGLHVTLAEVDEAYTVCQRRAHEDETVALSLGEMF
jgi:hypothetical protein